MKTALFIIESASENTRTLFTTMEEFSRNEETWGLCGDTLLAMKTTAHHLLMVQGAAIWIIAGKDIPSMLRLLDEHVAEHPPKTSYTPLITHSTSKVTQADIYRHLLEKNLQYRFRLITPLSH